LTILLLVATPIMGQQAGTLTPEVHLPFPWQQCQKGGHCTQVHGEIVADSSYRSAHNAQGQDCQKGGKWDPVSCPDDATCAKNCALEGMDYAKHGFSVNGSSLTHKFVNNGARLYLSANESHYELFKLLAQEFTFDVDISTLPCGMNGALYFVSMDADGGSARYPATNKAGAKYGTGYCDAQCPRNVKFLNDIGGQGKQGACCAEMDIWEANKEANVYTPHPCTTSAYAICTEACGSTCDSPGCDYNSYRQGNISFYGPGKVVDSNKIITVVTQFLTSDGTPNGNLTEIRRLYLQNGKLIPNSISKIAGTVTGDSITQEYCTKKGIDSFIQHGGLKQMGEAIRTGMVLTFSLWDDPSGHMLWLDSGTGGPCSADSGVPSQIESPNVHVTWSNIKVGPINSTFTQ